MIFSFIIDLKSKYVIIILSVKQGILKGFCFYFIMNVMYLIFFYVYYIKKILINYVERWICNLI